MNTQNNLHYTFGFIIQFTNIIYSTVYLSIIIRLFWWERVPELACAFCFWALIQLPKSLNETNRVTIYSLKLNKRIRGSFTQVILPHEVKLDVLEWLKELLKNIGSCRKHSIIRMSIINTFSIQCKYQDLNQCKLNFNRKYTKKEICFL